MNHSDFKRLQWLEAVLGGPTDRCVSFEFLPNGHILTKITDCDGAREYIGNNLRAAIDDAIKASAE